MKQQRTVERFVSAQKRAAKMHLFGIREKWLKNFLVSVSAAAKQHHIKFMMRSMLVKLAFYIVSAYFSSFFVSI